jgi:F0F1-type ATP synthase gamma subunit
MQMTIRELKDNKEEGLGLKLLTQAYTEIASIKLNRIRKEVEGTRVFYKEISGLYQLVKFMADQKQLRQPKKTVSILLTSNYRFNGHLNSSITTFFLNESSRYKTDLIVVGKLAIESLQKQNVQFKAVTLKKDLPDDIELDQLTMQLQGYTQILVYYCEFQTVLKQLPIIRDITQNAAEVATPELHKNTFIFEPEVLKILNFFDRQIKTALLQQTFLEAELARVASRLISMDQAATNANKFLESQEKLLKQTKKAKLNRSLLENWLSYTKAKEKQWL